MKKEFEVSIRVVQSATAYIEAEDWEEAEELARDALANGEYNEQLQESNEYYGPEITVNEI